MRLLSGFSFPLALLVALALLSTWLKHAVEVTDDGRDARKRHDPDFWIEQIALSRFDPEGELQYTLAAQRWTHYPDDDTTHVTTPQVRFRRAGQDDTLITAGRGVLTGPGDVVTLSDAVRIAGRKAAADALPWQADTARLTLVPDAETATTDADVLFTQGATRMQGTGLDFNQRERRLTLLHEVHGRIDRRKSR